MAPFHPLLTVESHIHFEAPLPCPSGPCNSLPHARTCTRHLSPPRARHPGPRHAFGPTTCTRVYLDFYIFFSLTTSPDSRCTYNVGRTWRMHPTRCLARQKTPTPGHSGRGAGRFRGLDGLMSDCDDLPWSAENKTLYLISDNIQRHSKLRYFSAELRYFTMYSQTKGHSKSTHKSHTHLVFLPIRYRHITHGTLAPHLGLPI